MSLKISEGGWTGIFTENNILSRLCNKSWTTVSSSFFCSFLFFTEEHLWNLSMQCEKKWSRYIDRVFINWSLYQERLLTKVTTWNVQLMHRRLNIIIIKTSQRNLAIMVIDYRGQKEIMKCENYRKPLF